MKKRYKMYSGYHPRLRILGEAGDALGESLSYIYADVRILLGAGRGLDLLQGVRLNNKMLNFVRWMRTEVDDCQTIKVFYSLASIFEYKYKSLPLVMSQVIHGWMMKRRAELVEQ